jgi:hypothetical protein
MQPVQPYAALNLPPAQLRIAQGAQGREVFDIIRKKNVALTPEEWVRQHMLHFLITHRGYPAGLIEVEKGIRVFNTDKRVDILVNTRALKPYLLVECKASGVTITQKEAEQLARYQISVGAPFSLLSNGVQHIVMQHTDGSIRYLEDIPLHSLSVG